MSKENLRPETLKILDNKILTPYTTDRQTAFSMLIQSPRGSEILQDGYVRHHLIEQAAYLQRLNPGYDDNLLELPAFLNKRMVAATSYESIRRLLKDNLNRIFLQSMLGPKIGHVLTSEGADYDAAATLSKPHTRPGTGHTEKAIKNIEKTFEEFKSQLQSKEGLSGTTLSVEMIYKIMTDTVFGGYQDEKIAEWKDDIVYFLKNLNRVQIPYGAGLLAEQQIQELPKKYSKWLPKGTPRKLMRFVAWAQGIPDVLDRMLYIEDHLFPKIAQWIDEQENLPKEKLAKMGFLGEVLSVPEEQRSKKLKRADIFGIYTAALDSTANAANWLFSEFAQNPEILRKVARLEGEARREYIKFILFELWRKDPITPIIFRQVPTNETRTMPDGSVLPSDTIVLLSVGAAGQDPVRFPEPKKFNPDRYYKMSDEEITQVQKDMYLVFAAGDKHRCQGEGAVNLTLHALINYMADHFDSINIAPTKDGKTVIPKSNESGVSSPVDQNDDVLNYQVVWK